MMLLTLVGDFYELVGEDARTAARELGLTLTKRRSDGLPMAGFPAHSLKARAAELLANGHELKVDNGFFLANDPTPHRPAQFENSEQRRQRVLVEGMGCLPGQLDLF
jgi:hypothetical protein